MHIGIIGTGNIGGTLGRLWARSHDVVFGARDPRAEEVRALVASAGERARAGTVAEAAASGDVVLLAVPFPAAQDALRAAGPLAGKVLVDCTNPVGAGLVSVVDPKSSGAEQVAAWAKGASVVKAFNTVGFNVMSNPRFGAESASMFLCGDDAAARATVASLAREIGFDVTDCGPLRLARALESLALAWIGLATGGLGREMAFKLLRR